MKAVELYNYLQKIIKEHGNCDIYHWDDCSSRYIKTNSVKFIEQKDFDPRFKEDENYSYNFKENLGNIILS